MKTRLLLPLFLALLLVAPLASAQIRYVGDHVAPPASVQKISSDSEQQSHQGKYEQQGDAPRTTENRQLKNITTSTNANEAVLKSNGLVNASPSVSDSDETSNNSSLDLKESKSSRNTSLGITLLIVGTVLAGYWMFLFRQRQ